MNALHRSLDWDADTLARLADELFETQTVARRITKAEVIAALMKIAIDDVEGAEARAFVAAQHKRAAK